MKLKQVLQTPGIYLLQSYSGFCFIEVDETINGSYICNQLEPITFKPDGELNTSGWNEEKILYIAGPFESTESLEGESQ